MSEYSKNENGSAQPQGAESDVIGLLKKLQQQMIFLEKKIDILVAQQSSGAQPSGDRQPDRPFKERHFSRPPFRPSFGGGSGFGRPDRDGGPGAGRDRGDRPQRGFSNDRPSYDRPRRSGPSGGPGTGGGFGGPKKPFYRGRKDRD